MADAVIRFKDKSNEVVVRSRSVLQEEVKYPVANLLYTDNANKPASLSKNAMMYLTDTGEVFIGTGTGIRLIDVTKDVRKDLQNLADAVYTKDEIDNFIEQDIDLDGIIDRLNTYTSEKVDEFITEKGQEIIAAKDEAIASTDKLRSDVKSYLKKYYALKTDVQALQESVYTKEEVYTKAEVDELIATVVNETIAAVLEAMPGMFLNNNSNQTEGEG